MKFHNRTDINTYTCIFSTDSNHADTNKESFNKETFENGKVKGFRNWTQPMEQDLLETGGKVLNNDPSLEKGSSAFNRVLLKVHKYNIELIKAKPLLHLYSFIFY